MSKEKSNKEKNVSVTKKFKNKDFAEKISKSQEIVGELESINQNVTNTKKHKSNSKLILRLKKIFVELKSEELSKKDCIKKFHEAILIISELKVSLEELYTNIKGMIDL